MQFFIPDIGFKLVLTNDWTFNLFAENRNDSLLACFGVSGSPWYNQEEIRKYKSKGFAEESPRMWAVKFTLPSDTVLTVDRVYIRKGANEYSSVSFNIPRESLTQDFLDAHPALRKGRLRFWVKTKDLENLHFSVYKS